MQLRRLLGLCLTVVSLAGCLSSAQWLTAAGEPASDEDIRTCRSLAGSQAAADSRGRGGLSVFTPGAQDDLVLSDTRYAGEERQRQKVYFDCMRRLGYRAR